MSTTLFQTTAWRRISLRSKERILLVDPMKIDWIEAYGNYVRFHIADGKHLLRGTLCSWEERLTGFGFVRVHRSALVNLSRVVSLEPTFCGDYTLRVTTGAKVPLSRTYRDAFFKALNEPALQATHIDALK